MSWSLSQTKATSEERLRGLFLSFLCMQAFSKVIRSWASKKFMSGWLVFCCSAIHLFLIISVTWYVQHQFQYFESRYSSPYLLLALLFCAAFVLFLNYSIKKIVIYSLHAPFFWTSQLKSRIFFWGHNQFIWNNNCKLVLLLTIGFVEIIVSFESQIVTLSLGQREYY